MDDVLYELVRRPARLFERLCSSEVTDPVSTIIPSAREVADRAVQKYGGTCCTRNMRYGHIYRHHRRCMTVQGEAVQIRTVAADVQGFTRGRAR